MFSSGKGGGGGEERNQAGGGPLRVHECTLQSGQSPLTNHNRCETRISGYQC